MKFFSWKTSNAYGNKFLLKFYLKPYLGNFGISGGGGKGYAEEVLACATCSIHCLYFSACRILCSLILLRNSTLNSDFWIKSGRFIYNASCKDVATYLVVGLEGSINGFEGGAVLGLSIVMVLVSIADK